MISRSRVLSAGSKHKHRITKLMHVRKWGNMDDFLIGEDAYDE
jgi:hypothetical protein